MRSLSVRWRAIEVEAKISLWKVRNEVTQFHPKISFGPFAFGSFANGDDPKMYNCFCSLKNRWQLYHLCHFIEDLIRYQQNYIEGIAKKLTDNGYEHITASFFKPNNWPGLIQYKPNVQLYYKKIERLGYLRELNFTIKSPLGEESYGLRKTHVNPSLVRKYPTKNSLFKIKYEIILIIDE